MANATGLYLKMFLSANFTVPLINFPCQDSRSPECKLAIAAVFGVACKAAVLAATARLIATLLRS
jgi:hypothetical protein